MTRSKFSTKAALLAGSIGLSMAGFAGSQPAVAQSYSDEYSCPAGSVYDLTYGCTLPGATYDTYGAYGTYGSYAPYDYGYYGYQPYGSYGSYYGGHPEFNHGFGHMGKGAEGTIAHHGMGFGRSISAAHFGGVNVAHLGRGGFAHGMGVAHVGGFGHGIGGGFHGGSGGHR
jgi:hypothetical protein